MVRSIGIGALTLCVGVGGAEAGIFDDFQGYDPGSVPGGVWQDAADYVTDPTNPGPTVSVIDTTDAMGNATRAVQINDGIGTSGGLIAGVDHTDIQRFEIDVRLDQRGNGNSPNWMSAVGFWQDTDQSDFNWSPQAVIYSAPNGRWRLFVQNNDGQGSFARDFGLGNASWSLDTWYRVGLEVNSVTGVFNASVVDLSSGEAIVDAQRTYLGWNTAFGQYDLISVNDGEYGTNPGTIGNMSSYDNARYTPAPGALGLLAMGGLLGARRRR